MKQVAVLRALGRGDQQVVPSEPVEGRAAVFLPDHHVVAVRTHDMNRNPFRTFEAEGAVGMADDPQRPALTRFVTLWPGNDGRDPQLVHVGRHLQHEIVGPAQIPQRVVAAVRLGADLCCVGAISPVVRIPGPARQHDRAVHRHHRVDPVGRVPGPRQVQPQFGRIAHQFVPQAVHRGAVGEVRCLAGIGHQVVDVFLAVGIAEIAQVAQIGRGGPHRQRAEDRGHGRLRFVKGAEAVVDQRQQALPRRPVGPARQPGQVHDRHGQVVQ